MNALCRRPRAVALCRDRASSDAGFTLIEVSVAAILMVAFSLGIATSFGAAFGVSRGNLLRQQATTVVNQELEFARSLRWDQLAMSEVDPAAPMIGTSGETLVGTEVGFAGEETLVVLPDTGLITPNRTHTLDGTSYEAWRYVTHSSGGSRRFVVFVTWSDEGSNESLLSATQISEVTARANSGSDGTLADGSPAPTTTTTSTTSTTTTTSSTTTTTTTLPGLVIDSMTLSFNLGSNQQTATVFVDYATGGNANGAVVHGRWSTDPAESGYPFTVYQTTSGAGRAQFIHNDGHPAGTIVQFCVTDIVLSGYSYTGGTQCVSGVWG